MNYRITKSGRADRRYKYQPVINQDIKKRETRKSEVKTKDVRKKSFLIALVLALAVNSGVTTAFAFRQSVHALQDHNRTTRKFVRPVDPESIKLIPMNTEGEPNGQGEHRPLSVVDMIHAKDWDGDLMEATGRWESGGYACELRPNAVNINTNGSEDRGIFQINSDTFKDFQNRKGLIMRNMGITHYDQMFDPQKNVDMAYLIWQEQGERAWVGYNHGLWKSCWGSRE